MLISHRHKFIYIKSYKTASTSIQVALAKVCGPDDIITRIKPNMPDGYKPRNDCHYRKGDHLKPEEIRGRIGEEIWASYHKIIAIRNPWEVCTSFYHWAKWEYDNKVRKRNKPFNYWVQDWNQQFISNSGKVQADTCIRYENLKQDYEQICKLLKTTCHLLPSIHKVAPDRVHYSLHFTDEQRDFIAKKCKKMIKFYGYTFEDKRCEY